MAQTYEERQAELLTYQQATLAELLERCPTAPDAAHRLHFTLDSGVRIRVECPGEEKCSQWYERFYESTGGGGRCGVEYECSEVGTEFLEWQAGPPFELTKLPVPFGFTWSGGGDDDPPEIEWWPLPVTGEE